MNIVKASIRNKASMDDNMIPLINIVFLMLIFFMVAGQIMRSEPVKVMLPSSVNDQHKPEDPVVIVVSTEGNIALDKTIISQDQLQQKLSEHVDTNENKQDLIVLVKVDANLAIERLRTVLSIIKSTGIKRVSLATQQLNNNDI